MNNGFIVINSDVGGLEHDFYFPYIGNNHPNWLIFFRGVAQPPTRKWKGSQVDKRDWFIMIQPKLEISGWHSRIALQNWSKNLRFWISSIDHVEGFFWTSSVYGSSRWGVFNGVPMGTPMIGWWLLYLTETIYYCNWFVVPSGAYILTFAHLWEGIVRRCK